MDEQTEYIITGTISELILQYASEKIGDNVTGDPVPLFIARAFAAHQRELDFNPTNVSQMIAHAKTNDLFVFADFEPGDVAVYKRATSEDYWCAVIAKPENAFLNVICAFPFRAGNIVPLGLCQVGPARWSNQWPVAGYIRFK